MKITCEENARIDEEIVRKALGLFVGDRSRRTIPPLSNQERALSEVEARRSTRCCNVPSTLLASYHPSGWNRKQIGTKLRDSLVQTNVAKMAVPAQRVHEMTPIVALPRRQQIFRQEEIVGGFSKDKTVDESEINKEMAVRRRMARDVEHRFWRSTEHFAL